MTSHALGSAFLKQAERATFTSSKRSVSVLHVTLTVSSAMAPEPQSAYEFSLQLSAPPGSSVLESFLLLQTPYDLINSRPACIKRPVETLRNFLAALIRPPQASRRLAILVVDPLVFIPHLLQTACWEACPCASAAYLSQLELGAKASLVHAPGLFLYKIIGLAESWLAHDLASYDSLDIVFDNESVDDVAELSW